MAINSSDFQYGIIKEVTAGVTPATPAFAIFPHIDGDSPMLTSDTVTSNVVRSNRASQGMRKINYRVEGALKTQLKRTTVIDTLFESAVGGTFATNVLKAGATDVSLTIEKRMNNGATNYYHRFVGTQVSKMTLTVDSQSNAEVGFDFLGLDRTESPTLITGATYVQPAATTDLCGLDVNNVTVAGLTATCRAIELTVEHDREAHDRLGSAAAADIGTAGFRKVMAKMTFYRTDLSPDTLLAKSDTAIAVSFRVGSAANGWQFDLPAANYTVPQDETDGSKTLFTVEFTARYDNTAATDFIITKLT